MRKNAVFPHSRARRKIEVPLQGMREKVRTTNYPDGFIHPAQTNFLRLPPLHVKTEHNSRRPKSCRHQTNGIPESLRITSKMRTLLWLRERNIKRHAHSRRLPRMSENTSVRNQKAVSSPSTVDATSFCP